MNLLPGLRARDSFSRPFYFALLKPDQNLHVTPNGGFIPFQSAPA